MHKSSKIDLAQKRLALDIEKQEYLILKDLLRLKHKYHPINVGANFMLDFLSETEEKDNTLFSETDKQPTTKERKHLMGIASDSKRMKQLKGMFANLLLIADSYLDSLAQRLEKKATQVQSSANDAPHEEEE